MSQESLARLSRGELEAEGGRPLPAKEVISLLDLNIDLDLALDLAAPIDLAVAANANVAAPIDAAVAANVLSESSTASALADQGVLINQYISGEAIATASQDAALNQSDDVIGADTGGALTETEGNAAPDDQTNIEAVDVPDIGGTLDGNLLNVDVNVALDADLAAPVAGAVAANANVAAPIDAAVSANIGSVGSEAVAIAQQDAIITQNLDGVVAEATADQQADIDQ
jgi:hypothetical protein